MKRLSVVPFFILSIIVIILGGCAAPAPAPVPTPTPAPTPAPTPMELTMWAAWPKDMEMTTAPFVDWFIDRVNQRGGNVGLKVKFLGGPEIFPAFEGAEAVGKGLADIGYLASVYYTGIIPEAEAWKLFRVTPEVERANGARAILDDVHRKKLNLTVMHRVDINDFFHLWLNVKRDKPDLSGLRLRSTPAYDSFIKALGGVPVATAGPEAYSAVERGVVQGYGFPPLEVKFRKMEGITKYIWGPPFYASPTVQLMNADKWNKLHPAQRDLLTAISVEIEKDSARVWKDAYNSAMKYFVEQAKLEWVKFSPADEKYFLDTASGAGWEGIIAKSPDIGAKLKALADPKKP